jgi:hypothetical protein
LILAIVIDGKVLPLFLHNGHTTHVGIIATNIGNLNPHKCVCMDLGISKILEK